MTTPITPQFAIEEVVLNRINIRYDPIWDGAAWVLTPADVKVEGIGNTSASGVHATPASVVLSMTDLPAGGQTALQQLYQFIEQAIADQYP